MKRSVVLGLIFISFWLSPAEEQGGSISATLEVRQGFRLLHLRGTPYEMGYQHGLLLRDEIRTLVQNYLYQEAFSTTPLPLPLLYHQARLVDARIPERYREEMRGMAEGAGLSYQDILLLNILPELLSERPEVAQDLLGARQIWSPPFLREYAYTPLSAAPIFAFIPPPAEASFIVFDGATRTGTLFQGLRFSSGVVPGSLLVILCEPEGGNAFLAVSWPGGVGVTTGLNEEKISVVAIPSPSEDSLAAGTPLSFVLRQVMEMSGDLPRALGIIASAPRMAGYNVLLGDGKPAAGTALEASAHLYEIFEAEQGYIVRDAFPTDPILSRLSTFFGGERDSSAWIEGILQRYGTFDLDRALHSVTHNCQRDACLPEEGQSIPGVVMAASDLELWVAISNPSGETEASGVNLLEELRR